MDSAARENLLTGADEITLTLQHQELIKRFEHNLERNEPWVFVNPRD